MRRLRCTIPSHIVRWQRIWPGQQSRSSKLRARTLWLLGYPEAALADADHALKDAREIGQAATLMYALFFTAFINIACGNYAAATAQADELVALADEKAALIWKALGMLDQGCLLVRTGKASDAVEMIASGIVAYRSTGSTLWMPLYLSYLAKAYSELGQFDDAWRCIGEAMTAMETTKEKMVRGRGLSHCRRNRAASRRSRMSRKRKRISSAPSPSPVNSKPSPGNSAPQ